LKWLLRVVAALGVLVVLVLLSVAGVWIWLRTEAGQRWGLKQILALAQPEVGALSIDTLRTDLWTHLRLEGVRIHDAGGKELLGLDTIDAEFSLGGLFAGALRVSRVQVTGLRADLAITDAGLDIAGLWPTGPVDDTPYAGVGLDIYVDGLEIAAGPLVLWAGDEYSLSETQLSGSIHLIGDSVVIERLVLDATGITPEVGDLSVRGGAAWSPDTLSAETIELHLGKQHLTASGAFETGIALTAHLELEELPWDLPVYGTFELDGPVTGSMDAPAVAFAVTTPGGRVDLIAAIDLRPSRPAWSATVLTEALAVHTFVDGLDPTVVDANMSADGEGLGWPDDLDAHASLDVSTTEAPAIGSGDLFGEVDLTGGVAVLRGIEATTPTGCVAMDGRVDLVGMWGEVDVATLDVHLEDLGRFGVDGLTGLARFAGTVAGDWSGEPAITVEGSLLAESVRAAGQVGATTLFGPVAARWQGEGGEASIRLAARGLRLGETRFVRASFDAVGALDGVALTAAADLRSGARTLLGVDLIGDLEALRFQLPRLVLSPTREETWVASGVPSVTLADDGLAALDIRLTSGNASIAASGSLHQRGAVDLEVAVVDLPVATFAPFTTQLAGAEGLIFVVGAVDGPFRGVGVTVDARVEGLTVPGQVHGVDLHLAVDGRGDTLRVDATVASERTLATLRGTLPVSFDLRAPALHTDAPIALHLVVPEATAEVWNAVLDAAEVPELRAGAEVNLRGTFVHPELVVAAVVELPVSKGGLDPSVPVGGSAPTSAASAGAVVREPAGPDRRITLILEASAAGDQASVDLEMSEAGEALATLAGSAKVELDRIAASLLGQGPAVDLGAPETWVSALDFTLTPLDTPLSALSAFTTIPEEVQGTLAGALHAEGALLAPVLRGALSLEDANLGGVAVSPATVRFEPEGEGYTVNAELGFDGGGLTLDGFLPVTVRGDLAAQLANPGLDLTIAGNGVPLAAIAGVWPELRAASGVLALNGTVKGSIGAPVPALRLSARDVAFQLATTGVAYDQVRIEAVADATSVRLEELHVRTTPIGSNPDRAIQGTIDATLEAKLEGTTLGAWHGMIALDRPLLSGAPDRFVRLASGRISVSGMPPEITVGGAVKVEEARLVVDQRSLTNRRDTLPTWLRVHRVGGEALVEAPVDEAGIPAWLNLALGLDLARQAFVRARLPLSDSLDSLLGPFATLAVDAQVDGRLQIGANDGVLSVEGQVVPLRGTTVLFGKPFEIQDDSSVSFTGRDFTSPVLALHAVYDTRRYGEIHANISGVPEALQVVLRSDDYPAQDDVVSLLLVGKPASEMSAGEGASEGASAAALGMLLTTVGQTLGREGERAAAMVIAPDLLVVGNETARIGKRLGTRLFVIVDIDNTADDQENSRLLLTVELAIAGAWQAEFTHGTAGEDSLSVFWTKRL
jgi:autotransporter translocation and assembly factor TamB